MSVRLVEATRSEIVESIHHGDITAVDSKGEVLFGLGDPERITYMRSASKPLQVIAALEMGIAEKYGLDLKEIAVMISSHGGEKQHIDVLRSLMYKMGIGEEELECGIHEPLSKDAAKELIALGLKPSKLHCNCSGKHIGLIAAANVKGFPVAGYYKGNHPVQLEATRIVSAFSRVQQENISKGVDGCGVPVFAMPLKNMAQSYANLCNPDFFGGTYKKSQNYVISAMTMYPEMVAGKCRLDTELMRNFGGRLVGKIGAEGVYCLGILQKGIGIALKIDDGNSRAVGPVIIETLLQMGIITREEANKVKEHWKPDILNHRGEKVGEVRSCFKIPYSNYIDAETLQPALSR